MSITSSRGNVPLKASIAIKILALLTAVATVAFSAFVLGFSRAEVTAIGRFLQNGLRLALHLFLQAVRWGARAAASLRALLTILRHLRLDVDDEAAAEAEFDALHP